MPVGSGTIGARATVTNKVQMTCNYNNGGNRQSNQWSVSGSVATQFVRLNWTSAANAILNPTFTPSEQNTVRNRVKTVLAQEFAGVNIVFANSPSGGVTKLTTLDIKGAGTGGSADYDRLNFCGPGWVRSPSGL